MRAPFRPLPVEHAAARFQTWLQSWLCEFIAWLVEALAPLEQNRRSPRWLRDAVAGARRQARQDLRETVRDLKLLVAARAYLSLAPKLYRPCWVDRTCRPASAPHGFRHARRAHLRARRVVGALVGDLHRGDLLTRAKRLSALLRDLAPLVARAAKRLRAALTHPRPAALILMHAFDPARSQIVARTPAFADTS